jgi:ribosomal protein S27AE
MARSDMKCPECGATMNHHGDKLIYESASTEPGVLLSGSIEEFYQCPNCGAGTSRPEIPGDRV